jgi:type I restriction enzyme S subunit
MFPKNGEVIPSLRFKGFNDEWQRYKFGEVMTIHPFKQYISAPRSDGIYEVVQQGSKPLLGHSNGEPFQKYHDVVLFGDHTVSIYKPRKPFFLATDGIKILSSSYMKGEFLYFILEKNKPEQQGYTRHFLIVKDVDVQIPTSKIEQDKMSSILTMMDSLIILHQQKHEKLINVKKALLQKMFV